jgi:hypothetical protein
MPKRNREIETLLHLQDDKCYRCERSLGAGDAVDCDHKVRLADGGADEIHNKCVMCIPCHREKTRRENTMQSGVCFDYSEKGVNEYIRVKGVNGPKQIHQRYSILQLRGWWNDKALRPADFNRMPVWDVHKRRAFLVTLLEGGVTPPIFVNHVRTDSRRDIYDGVNRITTIMEFMAGREHVCYNPTQRRQIAATYGRCQVQDCRFKCVALDEINRRTFESIMVDVFEWDNLSTREACEIASHLNEGTPMSIGEKLKLLCGRNTPRSCILRYLYDSDAWQKLVSQDREKDRKILALFFRNVVAPDMSFSSHLTSNFAPLDNFYKSDAPVDERSVKRAEEIISRTSELLAHRVTTQRMLLICLIGLLAPGRYDVQGALTDADADVSVEDLLERWCRGDEINPE